MARTCKSGLDYFPFDVSFFDDDKIKLIEAEFGGKGVEITIRILTKIYKEGYYYKWGDDQCLLFAGTRFDPKFVNEVVVGLVKRQFFDKKCFAVYGILTSNGIQKRYFDAVRRYKKVYIISEYLLVNITDLNNADINSINVDINSQNAYSCTHNESESESNNESESEREIIPSPEVQKIISMNTEKEIKPVFKEISTDTRWLEVIAMNYKLKSVDRALDYLEKFMNKLRCEGTEYKSINDTKSHFSRWLNIELNHAK